MRQRCPPSDTEGRAPGGTHCKSAAAAWKAALRKTARNERLAQDDGGLRGLSDSSADIQCGRASEKRTLENCLNARKLLMTFFDAAKLLITMTFAARRLSREEGAAPGKGKDPPHCKSAGAAWKAALRKTARK